MKQCHLEVHNCVYIVRPGPRQRQSGYGRSGSSWGRAGHSLIVKLVELSEPQGKHHYEQFFRFFFYCCLLFFSMFHLLSLIRSSSIFLFLTSLYQYVFFCLSVSDSIYLSIYQLIYLPILVFIYASLCLSICSFFLLNCLLVFSKFCPSVLITVATPVSVSVSLSLSLLSLSLHSISGLFQALFQF